MLYQSRIDFDVLCLTETKLCDNSNGLFNISGYKIFSMNRNSNGGGVRIYVRDDIKATICRELSGVYETHESLILNLNCSGSSCVIGTFYRPPNKSIRQFNNYLDRVLMRNQNIISKKCIFIGDFNINLSPVSPWQRCVIRSNEIMNENGFVQHVQEMTHCCMRTGLPNSLIDHVWTNFEGNFAVGVHQIRVTDHLPIISLSFPLACEMTIKKT